MLIQTSMEVRWFCQGAVADQIWQWFDRGQPTLTQSEKREDRYLLLADHSDLGIKLRQGKLEIKHRTGDRGVQKIVKGVKGRIEQWQKWSFNLSSKDELPTHLPALQGFWLSVQKSRRLKTYQVVEGSIAAITSEDKPNQGCQIEVAEITALGQAWYSLGFEAFGQANTVEQTLMQGLAQTFDASEFSLKAKHSMSYPAWLLRLTA